MNYESREKSEYSFEVKKLSRFTVFSLTRNWNLTELYHSLNITPYTELLEQFETF